MEGRGRSSIPPSEPYFLTNLRLEARVLPLVEHFISAAHLYVARCCAPSERTHPGRLRQNVSALHSAKALIEPSRSTVVRWRLYSSFVDETGVQDHLA